MSGAVPTHLPVDLPAAVAALLPGRRRVAVLTGAGMSAETLAQVFEPFVSGRENGTGLGLALVSKIIADHGAWIALESRPGRTVFRLSLPKA